MPTREQLTEVLDHLPSAVFKLSPELEVTYRNRAAAILAPQIEVGMNLRSALDDSVNVEKVDRLLREKRVVFAPAPGSRKIEWFLSDERTEDGSFVLMAWDATITDEVIEYRTAFIMSASHELRTPLTALMGFSEILELERDPLNPRLAEAAAMITLNARHLQKMVDDIIDLSRNSFGELRLDLQTMDVVLPVKQVCESMRPQIEAKGQSLEFQAEAGITPVQADEGRVRQIIFNLLQNAHAHNGTGTSIQVSISLADQNVLVRVRDDGKGVVFDNPEDAFRSFRRGQPASDLSIPGSGIGLTISRQLAFLHRGTLEVDSQPGRGSTFTLCLPLDREADWTQNRPALL